MFICGEVGKLFMVSGRLTLERLHSSLVCKKREWDDLVLEDAENVALQAVSNVYLIRS